MFEVSVGYYCTTSMFEVSVGYYCTTSMFDLTETGFTTFVKITLKGKKYPLIRRSIESVEPLKALYTATPGGFVHS